jgi:hypothetical protein
MMLAAVQAIIAMKTKKLNFVCASVFASCAALAGCGGDGTKGADSGVPDDMAVAHDFAAAPDFATPPDLRTGPIDVDGGVSSGCAPVSAGNTKKLVVSGFVQPTEQTNFAWNLDGDRARNQYGLLLDVFETENLDGQDAANLQATIANGSDVVLLEATSSDPSFQNDSCAATNVYQAVVQANPVLDGTGAFAIDPSVPVAAFRGPRIRRFRRARAAHRRAHRVDVADDRQQRASQRADQRRDSRDRRDEHRRADAGDRLHGRHPAAAANVDG